MINPQAPPPAVQPAGGQTTTLPTPPALPVTLHHDITEVVGQELSAGVLANIIAGGGAKLDINTLLSGAGLDGLPFHQRPDDVVWKVLDVGNKAAAKEHRRAFFLPGLDGERTPRHPYLP